MNIGTECNKVSANSVSVCFYDFIQGYCQHDLKIYSKPYDLLFDNVPGVTFTIAVDGVLNES
jgi:hypothetical protein